MWTHFERTVRAARRLPVLALAFCLFAGAPVLARADTDVLPQTREIAPIASLFARVHTRFSGRILTVELEESDPPAYEVKLLTERGHVLKLSYNAQTLSLESVVGQRDRDELIGERDPAVNEDNDPDDDDADGDDDDADGDDDDDDADSDDIDDRDDDDDDDDRDDEGRDDDDRDDDRGDSSGPGGGGDNSGPGGGDD